MTPGSFRGWVFPPGLATRAPVTLSVMRDGVRAIPVDPVSVSGVEVSWPELRLEIGGAEGRTVFCRHHGSGAVVCCDDPAFLAALRDETSPQLREQLGIADGAHVTARRRRRAGLAAIAIAIIGMLGGGYLLVTWGAGKAIDAMPPSVDRKLGDGAMSSMDLGGDVVDAAKAKTAIAAMVARLKVAAARQDFDFRISIVDSPQINAFALPGGQIVVYTGLLRKATRAEQVAGVLAHEMAHVTLRHGLHSIARSAGIWIAFQIVLGDPSGLGGLATQGAMNAVINGYSRDQERAADSEGARTLAAAGVDVRGMSEFFALLKSEPGSESTGIAAWFSTHPEHDERIAGIAALAAKLQPEAPPPLDIDWADIVSSLPPAKEP